MGLTFFKGPFWGAYVRREICVSKSIRLALFLEGSLPFFFVLLCIWRQFPSTSPRGGLYLKGQFNGGFFALWVWGAYIWRGLFSEFYAIWFWAPCLYYYKPFLFKRDKRNLVLPWEQTSPILCPHFACDGCSNKNILYSKIASLIVAGRGKHKVIIT